MGFFMSHEFFPKYFCTCYKWHCFLNFLLGWFTINLQKCYGFLYVDILYLVCMLHLLFLILCEFLDCFICKIMLWASKNNITFSFHIMKASFLFLAYLLYPWLLLILKRCEICGYPSNIIFLPIVFKNFLSAFFVTSIVEKLLSL